MSRRAWWSSLVGIVLVWSVIIGGCMALLGCVPVSVTPDLIKELAADRNWACLHIGATPYTPEFIVVRGGGDQGMSAKCGADTLTGAAAGAQGGTVITGPTTINQAPVATPAPVSVAPKP